MKIKSYILDLKINGSQYVDSESINIIAYWSLICICKLGGIDQLIEDRRIRNKKIASFFGLSALSEYDATINDLLFEQGYSVDSNQQINTRLVLKESFLKLLTTLEQSEKQSSFILETNIEKLSVLIGLNTIEKDILRFVAYIKYYELMEDIGDTIGQISTDQFYSALSVLLNHPKDDIRITLSPSGRLAQTGILSVDRHHHALSLRNKIDIGNRDFIDKMMTCDDQEIEEMIKDSVRQCTDVSLSIDDYDHLKDETSMMISYLKTAIETKRQGSNILLYGRPGTGKTELVKTIAAQLNVELFEVSYADEDDDPIGGERRLKAFRIAQTLLQKKNVIIMFDEIEDVMKEEDSGMFGGRKKQNNKAWLNRILENNNIPAIWITNRIRAMDEAIVRRFDMVYEIPVPPKRKRKEIINRSTHEFISSESVDRIAQHENIAPALITRAANVIECIGDEHDRSKTFEKLIENTLKAQGYRGLSTQKPYNLPETYDPALVNSDHDLVALAEGISSHQSARICLYGAPGTGKSAFGQWIAKELDRPCIIKKGSDLISMWVGGTEKNIANAFKEATDENAVLIFDEVDSFLQDRLTAKASWEVTQVNEMLVQMENYEGIFIATTNLMDGLDQASLRRFDLKLEFGYLKSDQAWELFRKEAAMMGINDYLSVENEIRKLRVLTPGDFAAVRRQSRFSPIKTADDLFDRLVNEVQIKQQHDSKKMGFL